MTSIIHLYRLRQSSGPQNEREQARIREKLLSPAVLLTRKWGGRREVYSQIKRKQDTGNSGLEGQIHYVSYSLWNPASK